MRRHEIVIIGAGPAGCAAAVQCARLGVAPVLMDASGHAGGLVRNGFLVENYPGLEAPISGEELVARFQRHIDRFGVAVECSAVAGVHRDGGRWRVRTDGEDVEAGCVIVATGTVPRAAGIDGEAALAGRLLFYEVRDLLGDIPFPKRVAVIGGGEAAFDYALSCAAAGAEVEILVRGRAPRVRGRLVGMVAAAPGIAVETGVSVLSLSREENRAAAIVESGTGRRRIEADAFLVAVGREPAAAARGLTAGRGLFICGDARLGGLGQVGIAVGDGLGAAARAVAMPGWDGTRWP